MVYKKKKGWKPGVNTLVYYDFENDTTSVVNNKGTLGSTLNATPYGITYTTLSSGKKVAQYTGGSGDTGILANNNITIPNALTQAVWIKGSGTSREGNFGLWAGSNNECNYSFNADGYKTVFACMKPTNSWVFHCRTNTVVLDNSWHLLTWTYDTTNGNKFYLDTTELSMSYDQGNNMSSPVLGDRKIAVGYNVLKDYGSWGFSGQCGAYIFENKSWSLADISNYRDLTKYNYGL